MVTAGTTNFDGTITVRATAAGGDAAISNIVNLVESAQGRSAPIQRLADDVAGRFTYGVMGAAAATFLFWAGVGTRLFPHVLNSYIITGSSNFAATISLSLQLACSVLVVACPCALGLAAPTAVLVGTGAGARKGLLVRGGDVLETSSKIDTVVFDKTGTLTKGKPTVVKFTSLSKSMSPETCLELAAAVEEYSSHPVAQSIVRKASETPNFQRREIFPGTFHQVPGCGAEGVVDGDSIYVGNLDWVIERTEALNNRDALDGFATEPAPGHSTVYIAVNQSIVGVAEIADELRREAGSVLQQLQKMGMQAVMLSGDQKATALHVASQIGISADNVISNVTPVGKVDAIKELQNAGHKVAMIGDGVNDAAALAESDVGIAMGGGVAVASEVADIVLLGDRLPQVLDVIRLSHMTMSTIKQNMAWAFAYNLVCIPLAAGALLPTHAIGLTPALSGALMGCSSLAVMANSLFLQKRAKQL
jgi:Cu2+-exporting ATPase